MIPAPQYTLHEAIGVCLALCQRALAEVRALRANAGTKGRARGTRQARAARRTRRQGRDRPQRQRPDVPAGRRRRAGRAARSRPQHSPRRTVAAPCAGPSARPSTKSRPPSCSMPASGERARLMSPAMASRLGGSLFHRPGRHHRQAWHIRRMAPCRQARHRWPRSPGPERALEPVRFK